MRKTLMLGHFVGVCLLVTSSAWGQAGSNSGVIAGEVDDSSGAKVSGAKVEITSPALIDRARDLQTGDDGLYKFVNVPSGVYVVTTSQAGFNTAKRENIEVTTGFTATVNFSLTPGSIEQTVTVSGEAPVLDTQDSNVQNIISNTVIESLPIGKSASDYPSLIPGAVAGATNQDVGGLRGENNQGFRIHGSASGDYAQLRDGMYWNTLLGAGNLMSSNNATATQEVQIETSGYSAEDWNSGGHVNIIPKNGGNDFHGTVSGDFGLHSLQGNNVTTALQNLGVPTPSAIKQLWEVAGGVGGPIKKDKLWFFADARHWISSSYQAGNLYFYDANEAAVFPNNLYYFTDQSRRAYDLNYYTDVGLRLTWQATKRNQFTENFIEEKNCNCIYQLITGTMAPEATTNHAYQPNWREQATWTFPASNKLVLWAGFSAVVGTINDTHTGDLPTSIPVQDLTHSYTYGANDASSGCPSTIGICDFLDMNENFTASYVTGAHAFKVGYTEMQGRGRRLNRYVNQAGLGGYPLGVQLQMSCRTITDVAGVPYNPLLLDAAGLPTTSYKIVGNTSTFAAPAIANTTKNSLGCPVVTSGTPSTQALLPSNVIQFLAPIDYHVTVENHMVFAQDQWRLKRLTLNLGVRFDWFLAGNQKESTPANPQYGLAAVNFPAQTQMNLKDLSPRFGAAYDVFGNGKTAIKASFARSVFFEALGSSINNPVLQLVTSTTRSFNDVNGNFMPDASFLLGGAANGELGAAATPGFYGQANAANVSYANDITHGWMNRPYDWMLTASVQQEVTRGVALSFDYYRTWFGNFTVAQNTAIPNPSFYDPYCVTPPTNTAYSTGGTPLCNLYDPNPALFTGGKLPTSTWLVKNASAFSCSNSNNAPGCGNESSVFTGIDGLVNARFHGLMVQGGISAGHEVTNYCVQVNSPQDLHWTSNPSPNSSSIVQFTNNNFGTVNDAAPCLIRPPWSQTLQFKMLVVYTLPWQKIKLSANEQNLPSIPLQASYQYSNSTGTFAFTSGRTSLSSVNGSTYKVEVLPPNIIYPYGRNNQLDFRVAKEFTIKERWKFEPTVDFFNLLNAASILSIGTTYNTSLPPSGSSVFPAGAWRNVSSLLPARMVKFGLHINF